MTGANPAFPTTLPFSGEIYPPQGGGVELSINIPAEKLQQEPEIGDDIGYVVIQNINDQESEPTKMRLIVNTEDDRGDVLYYATAGGLTNSPFVIEINFSQQTAQAYFNLQDDDPVIQVQSIYVYW